ncbi:DNA repair protein RecN [Euzebya tangerina]|uniref:DNA repair protein RecN n=1 Tax=Euzebya tangerina TaxID=591198 RepID=UPI000E31CF30|nr:DNA repair protein RecN [Euzebya tangerina]
MLTDLEIAGLGLIDRLSLPLSPGLNVLTGETGAGKTMVVTGLQWLLGGRADKEKVRAGADSALLQARIEPVPDAAAEWADDDDALIVTREVGGKGADGSPTGRSRARVGSQLAPVSVLAEILGGVVEVHSQHESIRMADGDVQRELLDRFGGADIATIRARYDAAYAAWRAAATRLEDAEVAARDGAREADRLRVEVSEIDEVDPAAGEEDQLDADIARLQYVEDLRDGAAVAAEAVTADDGARDLLGTAVAALRPVAEHDLHLQDLLERLETASVEVQELGFDLAGYAEDLESDPEALQTALGRRAAIGRLLRKYGPATTDVRAYVSQARERLSLIDGGEERLEELRSELRAVAETLHTVGGQLRAARRKAGNRLAKAIDGHLSELAMQHARTRIEVSDIQPGPHGCDRIEFLLSANRGQPALPLGSAASGGERSRVALAVKVALADADDTAVMVFDEVDAGIGGETALAVGRKLARLAEGRQVLCVTHLAQLAAFADSHHVISKHTRGATTATAITSLDEHERAAELSRMLSGDRQSDAALTHAQELLDQAASLR